MNLAILKSLELFISALQVMAESIIKNVTSDLSDKDKVQLYRYVL